MNEFVSETDDIALDMDDIPRFDSKSAGIASASQLVDGTNDDGIDVYYTT